MAALEFRAYSVNAQGRLKVGPGNPWSERALAPGLAVIQRATNALDVARSWWRPAGQT